MNAKNSTTGPGRIKRLRAATAAGGLVLLCAWCAVAAAVTVHTWVDAAGVRHFADTPPVDGTTASESMEIAANGASPAAEDDYYSIVNQWARLREERDAADALSLERERLRSEREQVAPPPLEPIPRGGYYGVPLPYGIAGYGYPRGHAGGHHGEVSRSEYVTAKRRHAFLPIPAPRWPR